MTITITIKTTNGTKKVKNISEFHDFIHDGLNPVSGGGDYDKNI